MTNKTLPAPAKDNQQVREYVAAAKRGLNSQFVTKSANGWSVRTVKNAKTSGVFATKAAAVKHAKQIAESKNGEIYIFDVHDKLAERTGY